MATRLNPSVFRGLLLHDPRFSLANLSADSSYQEAGAEPAAPEETVSGEMSLDAGGELTTDAAIDMRITGWKSGAPIGGDKGGRFVWRYGSDTVADRRGHLEVNKVTGWEHAAYHATDAYERPHAVTLSDHTVMVAYSDTTNGSLKCATLNPADDTWTLTTIDSTVPGPGCLVALPGGRVVCIYLRDDYTAGGARFTLGRAFTDDNGATWTVDATHAEGWSTLQSANDAIRQIRAVYHDGFITCMIEAEIVASPYIQGYHLVSDDRGASWDQIEEMPSTPDATDGMSYNLIPRPDGSVVVIYIEDGSVRYVRKTSPRSVLADEPSYDTAISGTAPEALSGSLTACLFEDAIWLAYLESTSGNGYNLCTRRIDPDTLLPDRTRWSASRDTAGGIVPNDAADLGTDENELIRQLCVTPYKAGLVLLHQPYADAANTGNIGALYLGGYSSLDWEVQTFGTHRGGGGDLTYGMLFLGSHDPATIAAWTATGAATVANNTDGYQITSVSNALSVTRNGPSSTPAGAPCLARFRIKVTSGGVLGTDKIALRLRRANGTYDYDVSVQFTTTSIRVWDNNAGGGAGAAVGSDTTGLSAGALLDVIVGLDSDQVSVRWKRPGDTRWTLVAQGTVTNDSGSPASTNAVTWGVLDSTGDATVTWVFVGSCIDQAQQAHRVQQFANPDDLQGRAFSTGLQWLGEDEGYLIAAKGGSVSRNDAWTAASAAQYGLRNIFPEIEPSREVDWRTTTAAATQTIEWEPNTDGSGNPLATRLLSSSIGLYVAGCNVKTITFQGRQVGTSTWDTLITLNQALTTATNTLTADLSGDWLRPASSTLEGLRHFEGGELIGGHAILTWTGGGGGTASFEITDNTEGVWRDPANSRAVEIRLDGDTSSVSGTVTVELLPPASVAVAHGVTTAYDGYRLRIAGGQTVPDNQYRLGVFAVGPLLIFGTQYSRGRVISDRAQFEEYTYADGAIRRRRLHRPRRVAEMTWQEGIVANDLYGTGPDPTYLTARNASGYPGIALRADHAFASGLLRRCGGVQPVVYCPRIEAPTGEAPESKAYSGAEYVFGWPSPESSATLRLGDELANPAVTLDAISVTEIL